MGLSTEFNGLLFPTPFSCSPVLEHYYSSLLGHIVPKNTFTVEGNADARIVRCSGAPTCAFALSCREQPLGWTFDIINSAHAEECLLTLASRGSLTVEVSPPSSTSKPVHSSADVQHSGSPSISDSLTTDDDALFSRLSAETEVTEPTTSSLVDGSPRSEVACHDHAEKDSKWSPLFAAQGRLHVKVQHFVDARRSGAVTARLWQAGLQDGSPAAFMTTAQWTTFIHQANVHEVADAQELENLSSWTGQSAVARTIV